LSEMNWIRTSLSFAAFSCLLCFSSCEEERAALKDKDKDPKPPVSTGFYFGADLSYANQVMDRGGVFKGGGKAGNPYQILKDHGASLARFRLWHNPVWTREVYGDQDAQMYNDLKDVEKSLKEAAALGMMTLLDFHYSDSWADPGKQVAPHAWKDIKSLEVLKDSAYQYTKNTLVYLHAKEVLPDMVQLGNEINCGMLTSGAEAGFPALDVCDNGWNSFGAVMNEAIRAVREVEEIAGKKIAIILHVADPKNADWWFSNAMQNGGITDFDMIGLSYYPLWHRTIPLDGLSETIASLISKFKKETIVLETAYPWTTEGADNYHNIMGGEEPLSGFPFTKEGQLNLLKALTQEIIDGGGSGVVYWEPAWISSGMKDLWGTGSSWENCALFDFEGNALPAMDYMNANYSKTID